MEYLFCEKGKLSYASSSLKASENNSLYPVTQEQQQQQIYSSHFAY